MTAGVGLLLLLLFPRKQADLRVALFQALPDPAYGIGNQALQRAIQSALPLLV